MFIPSHWCLKYKNEVQKSLIYLKCKISYAFIFITISIPVTLKKQLISTYLNKFTAYSLKCMFICALASTSQTIPTNLLHPSFKNYFGQNFSLPPLTPHQLEHAIPQQCHFRDSAVSIHVTPLSDHTSQTIENFKNLVTLSEIKQSSFYRWWNLIFERGR